MHAQSTDEVKPSSGATSWIVSAVGGGLGIAGATVALAAFALKPPHSGSSHTLFATLGLLSLFAVIVAILVRRLARGRTELTTPESAKPKEVDEAVDEAVGLTRRVRLLRGNDDL